LLAGALTLLPSVISIAIYPLLTAAHGRDDAGYARVLLTASRAVFAVIVPIAAFVIIDGERIAVFIGGADYAPAGAAMCVMIAGTAGIHALIMLQTALQSAGRTRLVLLAFGTQSLLTIVGVPIALAMTADTAPGTQAVVAAAVFAVATLIGLLTGLVSREGAMAVAAVARASLLPAIAGSVAAVGLAATPAEWITTGAASRVAIGADLALRGVAGGLVVIGLLAATGGITRQDLRLAFGRASLPPASPSLPK
jgi:O-antigen/teichoic acid export membrane protein